MWTGHPCGHSGSHLCSLLCDWQMGCLSNPQHHCLSLCVLLQMSSMFPKLRRAIRNYVPTSERCSTKLWLPLVLPLVFLKLYALAGGGKGQPSLMCEARNGRPRHWLRPHGTHMSLRTHTEL